MGNTQNALFPYYVVYVADDGEVKLSFLHTKKTLDYYKKLCSRQNKVIKELVDEFNLSSNDGIKMSHYSNLLETAIKNLIGKKQEICVTILFSKGGITMQKDFLMV